MKILKEIKYYFLYRFLSGHISIKNITVYGRNAMHWGATIRTKKYGYICFRLPLFCFGKWWPLYFYLSPNATTWASTLFYGKKHSLNDWATSRLRYKYLGHNFDTNVNIKTMNSIDYFHPGNDNEIVNILKRSKAEIKAYSLSMGVKYNEVLMSDLERYINIYGGGKDNE